MLSQATIASTGRTRIHAIALESRLRRVILGSRGAVRPELILSVHATDGSALGYAVMDRLIVGRTWGGITSSEHGTIEEACSLARAATLQMGLHDLRTGSHHCLLSLPVGTDARVHAMRREEFLAALRPLTANGLCTIMYGGKGDGSTGMVARRGLAASASTAVLFALEQLRIERTSATIACPQRTRDVEDVIHALADYGVLTLGATHTSADVALLDCPAELEPAEVRRLRARAIVPLRPLRLSHGLARSLHECGVLVIPDTAAAAGRFVALDLCDQGLDLESAVRLTCASTRERLRDLLGHGSAAGPSLGETLRAHGAGSA